MATKEWKDRHKMFVRYSTLLPGQQKYSDHGQQISGRIETTQIYLAKPGKRKLGVLNGIREDTCHLDINLNNTAVLTFDVDRIVDGDVSNFYDRIQRHMELQIPDIGWFKINEEPTVENDGNTEYMSVRAESLEIELQQYMLKGFEVNTGSTSSLEFLASDNVYSVNEHNEILTGRQIQESKLNGTDPVMFTFARENVKFYRDTTDYENLLEILPQDITAEQLLDYIPEHPCILDSWRITYNLASLDAAIQRLVELGEESGQNMSSLKSQIGQIKTDTEAFTLTRLYPALLSVTDEEGNRILKFENLNLTSYDEYHPEDYTVWEILDMELERRHGLSLMWVLLDQHNWKVGFVDNEIDLGTETTNPIETTEGDPLYASYDLLSQLTAVDFISSGSDDDLTPLCDKVGRFEVEADSIYSFMTQQMASYFRCMFVFDSINNEVNCYSITHVGCDTNIFLSFRNIQNSVERTGEDELVTAFYVQGGEELNIYEANFGQNYITDISYFLNTNHFSQEFVNKYRFWENYRENLRSTYMHHAIDYRKKLDIATEIYDRVPVDGVDTNQYASFTEEQLVEERAKYEALKKGYEDYYVDENGNFDIEKLRRSDDWMDYYIITSQILSDPLDAFGAIVYQDVYIDEDGEYQYEDYLLGIREKDESGEYIIVDDHYVFEKDEYGNYVEDINARLGNIDIALMNRYIANGEFVEDGDSATVKQGKTNYKIQREYLEDYIYDFDSYGNAYGLAELLNQQMDLYNKWQTLWAKGFGEPQDEDSEDYDPYHEEQHELYVKYYDAWESCSRAVAMRKSEYETAVAAYEAISRLMRDIEDDVDIKNVQFGFTEAELKLLDQYYIYSDYVNENIITTSIYTAEEIVNTEYKLIKDAKEELYASSHPQYQWSTSQDNLLLMPEFHDWHGQLDIGNYVRVGFRDDEPREEAKMLVDDNGYVLTDENGYAYTGNTEQLQNFSNNQVKMRIITIGLNPFMIEPTIDLTFSSMIQYKSRRNDFVELLNMTTNAAANQITAKITSQQRGDNDFVIDSKFVQKLLANGSFAGFMNGQTAGAVGSITSGTESLTVPILNALKVFAQDVEAQTVKATVANFTEVYTSYLDADAVVARVLSADTANFNTLSTEVLTADDMSVFNSTIVNSTVDTQWVKNQIASRIQVADLIAGDITVSNQMRIISDNGYLVMDGNRLQIGAHEDNQGNIIPQIQLGYATNNEPSLVFKDRSGNSGIVIGYPDNTGKPSIAIYDTDGNILLNSGGIQSSGGRVLADELIVNDMVKPSTLSKDRMNFNVMEVGDDVVIEQVVYQDGTKFGTEYTAYKQSVADSFSSMNNTISGVSSIVDSINQSITNKIWQTDITSSINSYDSSTAQAIRDRVTQTETSISGITSTVSDIQSDIGDPSDSQSTNTVYGKIAKAQQTADGFMQTVTESYATKAYADQSEADAISSANSYTQSQITQTANTINLRIDDVEDIAKATIKNVEVQYLKTSSSTTVPSKDDPGWSATSPTWEAGKYIWQMTVTTTSTGTSKSNPICISGRDGQDGQDGDDGRGIASVTPLYYQTNSTTTPKLPDAESGAVPENPDGTIGWSPICPTWAENKYIWTTSKIVYENPSGTVYTTPYRDNSTEAYSTAHSEITVQKNRINLITESAEGASSITLTDKAINAMTNQFVVKDVNGSQTVISGGKLTTQGIQSEDYTELLGTEFSGSGMWIGLADEGFIKAKNFALTSSGDAYFRGTINSGAGIIGDWNLLQKCLYSQTTLNNQELTVVFQNPDVDYAYSARMLDDDEIVVEQWFTQQDNIQFSINHIYGVYTVSLYATYPYDDFGISTDINYEISDAYYYVGDTDTYHSNKTTPSTMYRLNYLTPEGEDLFCESQNPSSSDMWIEYLIPSRSLRTLYQYDEDANEYYETLVEHSYEETVVNAGLPDGATPTRDQEEHLIYNGQIQCYGDGIEEGTCTFHITLPSATAGDTYLIRIAIHNTFNDTDVAWEDVMADDIHIDTINPADESQYQEVIDGIPRTAVLAIKRKEQDQSFTTLWYVDKAGDMLAQHLYIPDDINASDIESIFDETYDS